MHSLKWSPPIRCKLLVITHNSPKMSLRYLTPQNHQVPTLIPKPTIRMSTWNTQWRNNGNYPRFSIKKQVGFAQWGKNGPPRHSTQGCPWTEFLIRNVERDVSCFHVFKNFNFIHKHCLEVVVVRWGSVVNFALYTAVLYARVHNSREWCWPTLYFSGVFYDLYS